MDHQSFQLETYLDRIGCDGPSPPSEDRLEHLHRRQIYTIPFENFDILLGRGISLEPAVVFDKLISRSRGGYCFELNGLFLSAVLASGFQARPLLARVHLSGTPSGRSHQLTLIDIGGRQWIADVGFGSQSLHAPIPFELNRTAIQEHRTYRLIENEQFGFMLQSRSEEAWQNLYSFELGCVLPVDIEYGNHFTSTHPKSFFTYTRVAALAKPGGVDTLHNRRLSISTQDGAVVRELDEGQPYLDALRSTFGIVLDAPYEALRPLSP